MHWLRFFSEQKVGVENQVSRSQAEDWVLDSRQFVARHDAIDAMLAPALLERLAEEVVAAFAPVEVHVETARSPRGLPGMRVRLDGTVQVQCQRCMTPVAVRLAPRVRFELVDTESALDADDDDQWDAVLHSERFDMLHLLEDELLLALPFAPMHAACEPPADSEAGEKVMPFAALAGFKTRS